MWRLASCVYRAFRNTASHRCSQDVLIPIANFCNKDDDDDTSSERTETKSIENKFSINQIRKNNQWSYKTNQKSQRFLEKIAWDQIEHYQKKRNESKNCSKSNKNITNKDEETLETLLRADPNCLKTLNDLSDLQQEIQSNIDLQIAFDALESNNFSLAIESLEASAKNGTNMAALYNLGVCYEEGFGVEQNRSKACDYYRQASLLGHVEAQLSLTRLSNVLDLQEDDDDDETIVADTKSLPLFNSKRFRFSFNATDTDEFSADEMSFDWKSTNLLSVS